MLLMKLQLLLLLLLYKHLFRIPEICLLPVIHLPMDPQGVDNLVSSRTLSHFWNHLFPWHLGIFTSSALRQFQAVGIISRPCYGSENWGMLELPVDQDLARRGQNQKYHRWISPEMPLILFTTDRFNQTTMICCFVMFSRNGLAWFFDFTE